jgi:hypothetical protein
MAEREVSLSDRDIAQAVLPEIDEIRALGQVVGHELSRRTRQQYLTAMSDRPQPSAPDHRGPMYESLRTVIDDTGPPAATEAPVR